MVCDDRIDGVQLFRLLARRRITVIPQPVAAMKPGRTLVDALQRFFSATKNRDVGSAEFHGIEGVARCLLDFDISRYGCDRDHPDFGSAKGHDDGHRVVGGYVGVDEEGARHPRSITNQVWRRDAADC